MDAAARVLERMRDLPIVVVGDVCLDEYLIGRAERVSREAPVPVLNLRVRRCLPGGAANPAVNAAALVARVRQVGIVGARGGRRAARRARRGRHRRRWPRRRPVAADDDEDPRRRRGPVGAAAGGRIDRQDRRAVDGEVGRELADALGRAAIGCDAIPVSHYRSGVVTEALCDAARDAARANGALLTTDGQGDLGWFAGFDVVRVGRADAAASLAGPGRRGRLRGRRARAARRALGARVVVLGRGAQGTSVADHDGYRVVPPANVSEVFDVTGAGDTVIAMLTLALAAGAPTQLAVQLANVAAGLTVRRLGNAAPLPGEVLAELGRAVERGRAP
ncbi:MAG: PfkB family carbohydrate kinase [Anaerolineae bacterium]